MKTFVLLLCLSCCFTTFAKQRVIKLGYPEFPPFTYTSKHLAVGVGIEKFIPIAKHLNLKVEYIPIASYGKGVIWLAEGKIDGLMLASQNSERDEVATFTKPIMFNRWVWFTPKRASKKLHGEVAKQNLRVITHTKANTHTWLKESGYQIVESTTDVKTMIRLLMNERVDAVFLAELVFLDALKSTNWRAKDVKVTLERAQPFGIYFNKQFLTKYPTLLTEVNTQISQINSTLVHATTE
jgi:polar amino acid transport system substrate-binding protein